MKLITSDIKGILFDYGNTLISVELDWNRILPQNVSCMIRYLQSEDIPVNPKLFGKRFLELKQYYFDKGEITLQEYPLTDILQETLAGYGLNHITTSTLENAVLAYYTPEESAYTLICDAKSVLEKLKQYGFKLGLVSNALSGQMIRRSLKNKQLLSYFDGVVVSSDIGYRKPHPKIFNTALEQIQLSPKQTVVVGDVPAYDILGAKQLGMRSIQVKYIQSSEAKEPSSGAIQPDAIAHKITDIPEIVASFNVNGCHSTSSIS